MSEADHLREKLEKTLRQCDDLIAENLCKEERIQEVMAQLKSSSRGHVYDAVIGDDGAKIFRLDMGSLKKRRDKALERHRIEYENRMGTAHPSASSQPAGGYDEVDSKPLRD